MEFITMIHPAQKDSARLRKQAHSHAARVAHARAKRSRLAKYRELQKGKGGSGESDESPAAEVVVLAKQSWQTPSSNTEDIDPSTIPASPSGAFEHEPLASFLKSLTQREHFLFDYYVKTVTPEMQPRCPVLNYMGAQNEYMRKNWVLFSSTNPEFLKGHLLAACRHLAAESAESEYLELAIQYKLRYIRDLQEVLWTGDSSASRTAVSRALVLAIDDMMIRDITMASSHVLGAIRIIQAAGGIQNLGLTDLVQYILYSCIYGKGLIDMDPDIAASITSLKSTKTFSRGKVHRC